jgi:hypothetical protein
MLKPMLERILKKKQALKEQLDYTSSVCALHWCTMY